MPACFDLQLYFQFVDIKHASVGSNERQEKGISEIMDSKQKNVRVSNAAATEVVADSSCSDDETNKVDGLANHDAYAAASSINTADGYDTDCSFSSSEDYWDSVDLECNRVSAGNISDSDNAESADSLKSHLQVWAVDCNVNHHQLNKLLSLLKKFHSDLPLTAKTPLHTPQDMQCSSLSGGDYMYFGVEAELHTILTEKGN
jgi:hypothetical protein